MNKKISAGRIVSGSITAVSVLLGLLFFVYPLFCFKPNIGSVFGTAVTIGIAVLWLLYPLIKAHRPLKICFAAILALGALGVAYAVFLTANMVISANTPPVISANVSNGIADAPPLIIFGAKVNGNQPTATLESRLAAGLEYLERYPSAICVVSGGQGSDEDSTEASVMKSWLIAREIDKSRIYTEENSKSTWENLQYSTELLEELGYTDKTFAAASDGFHMYRISLMSQKLGYEAGALSSGSYSIFLPMYTVREWFALSAWYAGYYE